MNRSTLIITWGILVYDRNAAERFPLKLKSYRFNYTRATEAEAQEVLRLCDKRRCDGFPTENIAVGEFRESLDLGGGHWTSWEILQYRRLFDYVPDGTSLWDDIEGVCGCIGVNLPPDSYIEDENEHPISPMQVFDEQAQRKRGAGVTAVVLDHPETIVRHAPAEPIRPELWSQPDADLIAHLFEVCAQLLQSSWLRAPCVVTCIRKGEYNATLPVKEDCMAVILPFRQLYSKDSADDLFNRCCKLYKRHCPLGHLTHWWIAHYQSRFNAVLDAPLTFPLNSANLPAKRYLDAFAYGAKLVHASSRSSDPEADLNALLTAHPKEMVVAGYHSILRDLLRCVSLALPVLKHNINHWISNLGWLGGSGPKSRDVFG